MAWFSLSTFSPTTFTFTGNPYVPGVPGFLSPADVLVTDFTGGFSLLAPAPLLGLDPQDELDALDTPGVPEPPSLVALGLLLFITARAARKRRRQARGLGAGPLVIIGVAALSAPTFAWAAGADKFTAAKSITELPLTDDTNIKAFGRDTGEPTRTTAGCTATADPNFGVFGTAWFTYTPPATARLVAHTFGSTYNTVLAVFRAGNPDQIGNLVLVACNDNALWDTEGDTNFDVLHSQLVFTATAGTKYYFQIGRHADQTQFDLKFSLGVLQNAALLVTGYEMWAENRTHLEQALRRSPIWSHAVIVQLGAPNQNDLAQAINATYAGIPDDGISLFLYSGHGAKLRGQGRRRRDPGPPIDRAPPDEGAGQADELILPRSDLQIIDDDIGALFQDVRGRRVLVFDNCFSAGLIDTDTDFRQARSSVFLFSSGADQPSASVNVASANSQFQWGGARERHKHSWFSGSLITGLSRPGAENVAAADTNPKDGKVTVGEWFAFADKAVGEIRTAWNATGPDPLEVMDPELYDKEAPERKRADNIVIFTYTAGTPLLEHPGPTFEQRRLTDDSQQNEGHDVVSHQCGDCCEDFGDAPDPVASTPGEYPTRSDNAGPSHLNATKEENCPCPPSDQMALEWLGARIDAELDADPERDGLDRDLDGRDGDANDDAVTFKIVAPAALQIDVGVSILDRNIEAEDGTVGYDASDELKRLYLNAWADWDADGVWSQSDKIIGQAAGEFAIDPRADPQFLDDNKASYRFTVPVPSTAAAGEIHFRFRLDFGEDVGQIRAVDATLHEEKGTAQFGEVEDYCIVLVPLFTGTSPPVTGSTGTLTLSNNLAVTHLFSWTSSDSVLGPIVVDDVSARTWNYFPATASNPARLVFVGSRADTSIYGDVLFAPYNRAVVDVVKGTRRVRYLLKSSDCPMPAVAGT
jgi:hypothetical protein